MNRRPPWALIAPAALAMVLVGAPAVALVVRAPWTAVPHQLASSQARTALMLSLETSLLSTALALLIGVPLAVVQARLEFRGRRWLRALTTLPMVLPPVVGGVALLDAFGTHGLIGRGLYAAFGLRLPFTMWAAVLAETFVAMPFLVLSAEGGIRGVDPGLEDAARLLGAGPWTTFRRVTLPLARPAIISGAVLCWARALGEFGATITFAGNFKGRTQTLPLAIYTAIDSGGEGAVAMSLVLLVIAIAVLAALRDRWLTA